MNKGIDSYLGGGGGSSSDLERRGVGMILVVTLNIYLIRLCNIFCDPHPPPLLAVNFP